MASTDPFAQNVTFHTGDGTPFEVNVQEIDTFLQYCIQICTNYGAQLGASIVLFVILLLLTRPEKRSSSVFILNCAALLSNVGRLFCQILYFTTDFVRVYAYFSGDFSRVPTSAYANSVIAVVFYTILVICIEASLVLQVQVICANLGRVYRQVLLSLSIVVALIPVGFRMAMMVENAIAIMAAESSIPLIWLQSAENITATISICFFCAVFVAKLGFAIRQRRRLGVRDFGPMKVIFIMGCQTLVIPATFSIIHYIAAVPALSSNVATLVTISLPLSSIWAGVALTKYYYLFLDANCESSLNLLRGQWFL
ncbi:Mis12-Mtw1 family protein [Aspergillus niger]|uniref:Mis12-Mtw1 family protein n=1 Tax=Aspergillus niger TaxID=5061 RepID=A0A505I4I6_ASPNG|nr:Mis12-Mtw1 family protein [Aspergillus niger]